MSFLFAGLGALVLLLSLRILNRGGYSPFATAAAAELAQLPLLCLLLFRGRAEAVMSAAPGAAAAVLTLGLGLVCLIRPAKDGNLACVALVSLSAAAASCGFLANGALEGGEAGLLLLLFCASAWEGLRARERQPIRLRRCLRCAALLAAACVGASLLGIFVLDLVLSGGLRATGVSYVLLPSLASLPAILSAAFLAADGRGGDAALTLFHSAAVKLCLWLPLAGFIGPGWQMTQNLQVQFLPFLGIGAIAACFPVAAGRRTYRAQGIALLFLAGAYGILTWTA